MATVQQQTTQLEFHQAMADFKVMFPAMDDDVIEAVLRSNQGAVDATIDQLLAMTTDNENEKIRHELDEVDGSDLPRAACERGAAAASVTSNPKLKKHEEPISDGATLLDETPDLLSQVPVYASPTRAASDESEGASASAMPCDVVTSASRADVSDSGTPLRHQLGWVPPLLGQLPDDFLRLTLTPDSPSSLPNKQQSENELLEDERIALFLQNEEFMAELRWNKDFLLMLDKDSPPEERLTSFPHSKAGDEDAIFKERLRNMGKMSRKKFSQLARVFTGRKKRSSAKQILNQGPAPSRDNLLLQEDDSSDGV
ncbi:hypothetical protein LSTR_LSTR010661 [Laodelphax striatellus]|uniref:CUE domain-containing protein n=1 Tax=Laodelphax striatellus TaxID=195883 RepID=A0A482WU45_LAOST|nr:hypothetical protein LSTR_LSTR010661 [Laodelphax striatellus]